MAARKRLSPTSISTKPDPTDQKTTHNTSDNAFHLPLWNWDQSSWSPLSSARSTSTSSVSTTRLKPSWNAPSSSTSRLAWWVSSSRSRWSTSPPDTFWGVTRSVSISTRVARPRSRLKCESFDPYTIESFFLSICNSIVFFFLLQAWVVGYCCITITTSSPKNLFLLFLSICNSIVFFFYYRPDSVLRQFV